MQRAGVQAGELWCTPIEGFIFCGMGEHPTPGCSPLVVLAAGPECELIPGRDLPSAFGRPEQPPALWELLQAAAQRCSSSVHTTSTSQK